MGAQMRGSQRETSWEARFLATLYRLAFILWLVMSAAGMLGGWRMGLSLALGGGLSLGLLRFHDWLLHAVFARGLRRVKARLLVAWILKFPLLLVLLYLVLKRDWILPLPFAFALALVPSVATLKAIFAAWRGDFGLPAPVGEIGR